MLNPWDVTGWQVILLLVLFVGVPIIIIGLVARLALRAASRSSRPRENRWAAWSLILGVAPFLSWGLLGWSGPFAIWTGIKAYRMGGSKWMAVPGIVIGGVTLLRQVLG